MRSAGLAIVATSMALAAAGLTPAVAQQPVRVQAAPGQAAPVVGDVPVFGKPVVIRQSRRAGEPVAYAVVNAVRRVPGGTVLYYSIGYPADVDADDTQSIGLYPRPFIYDRWRPGAGIARQRLVDTASKKAYTTLPREKDNAGCICSVMNALPDDTGTMHSLYSAYPELAPGTKTVSVWLGHGAVVSGVPVGEGLLEPAVEGDDPIPLGTGWPAVDLADIAGAPEPRRSVHVLRQRVESIDRTTATTETAEEVSVAISSDVLFAVDSARLSPKAKAKLAAAAALINERAVDGKITIVGHTDSDGSDSHNQDLSKRRARAVADALRPLITVPGATFKVAGRGEDEPVASNGSDQGKAANRRVTISFTPKD